MFDIAEIGSHRGTRHPEEYRWFLSFYRPIFSSDCASNHQYTENSNIKGT